MRPSLLPFSLFLAIACTPEESDSGRNPPAVVDADGDGFSADADCDDTDPMVGGSEVPYDGIDNDCEPLTPDDDLDGDGLTQFQDCDDTDAGVGAGAVVWRGDADYIDFPGLCAGETSICVTGNVTVTGTWLGGLGDLSCVKSIGGDLTIGGFPNGDYGTGMHGGQAYDWSNPALTSLTGLESLQSVDGDVVIAGNQVLSSIAGLRSLSRIGGRLSISDNAPLTSLDGLEYLESVGGHLGITYGLNLTDLSALSGLTSVGDGVWIVGNTQLSSLQGLGGIESIGGDLTVTVNGVLLSLDGLSGLQTIGGTMTIGGNPNLGDLALASLHDAGGVLIADNPRLPDLTGATALTLVSGDVEILRNDALVSLNGLDGLTRITGELTIEDNAALASLEGLESLYQATGDVRITDNDALLTVAGLDGLRTVGDPDDENPGFGSGAGLLITANDALTDLVPLYDLNEVVGDVVLTDNQALSDEAAQALVDEIGSIGGDALVVGNSSP